MQDESRPSIEEYIVVEADELTVTPTVSSLSESEPREPRRKLETRSVHCAVI